MSLKLQIDEEHLLEIFERYNEGIKIQIRVSKYDIATVIVSAKNHSSIYLHDLIRHGYVLQSVHVYEDTTEFVIYRE